MIEKKLLVYVDELLRIQKELIRNNIHAVYLKGVVQYYSLTGHWPGNNPVDIDILIPPGSFSQVRWVLKSLRFLMHQKYKSPASRPQVSFVKKHAFMTIVCDVHNQIFFPTKYIFNVLPPKLVKQITAEFLGRAKTISFQNQEFRILEPEDMLLHQCLNFFFHHSCRNTHQINDIALIVKRTNINWKVILARLSLWNLKEFAYYPLLLTKQVSKAKVPNFVLKQLRPKSLLAIFAPLFVNSRTISFPIKNMHVRFRYNILLRFLISDQPTLQKIGIGCLQLLLSIFPARAKPTE